MRTAGQRIGGVVARRNATVVRERLFVDDVTMTRPVVDATTGKARDTQVLVCAVGASHLPSVDATWTQTLSDWIGAPVRMLASTGGMPALLVPDNLKSAVSQPCDYDSTVHATYQDLATHDGTGVLPTRAYHSRDKAKVETAVQIVEREILAPLRPELSYSLAAVCGARGGGYTIVRHGVDVRCNVTVEHAHP